MREWEIELYIYNRIPDRNFNTKKSTNKAMIEGEDNNKAANDDISGERLIIDGKFVFNLQVKG